jgi:two-component system sensor histidine kinase/response regulator
MAGKKVLVVDDSLSSVLMQKLMLQHERYEVVTATDGEAAVATAIAEQPDLILMDVVMPRMSGFEACRKLRATRSTQHVPIIMTTTRHKLASLGKEATSNETEYLMKPIDRQELLAKVDRYLSN